MAMKPRAMKKKPVAMKRGGKKMMRGGMAKNGYEARWQSMAQKKVKL